MAQRLSILAALLMLGLTAPAAAIDAPTKANVWQGASGTEAAVSGHDPVAYFSGSATMGNSDIAITYQGARYLFASIENRDTFLANPARYLPAFGGHCAWAASEGRKAGGDPKVFRIDDGKLYLNCSKAAEAKWLEGQPGTLARATEWWAAQTR